MLFTGSVRSGSRILPVWSGPVSGPTGNIFSPVDRMTPLVVSQKDPCDEVHQVSNGLVQFRDFGKPQRIGVYDWVYSIEVGEHIPKEYEETYIQNLVRAAKKGKALTFVDH